MAGTTGAAATSAIVASMQTDAHAVGLLHEANLGEIRAGTLAQQQAGDSAVRQFAAMMVEEHRTLDQQGNELGQRLGISPVLPDSQLPQLQEREVSALPAGAATEFDRAYITQQVAAHQRTLALVDAAIQRAQNAELRTMLESQVRPRVAAHLQMAQDLQQRIGR